MKDTLRQNEYSIRSSDKLPFADTRAIKGAIVAIFDGLQAIKSGSGQIVFPYELSNFEKNRVMQHLGRHNGSLLTRIDGIVPIRLEEGVGTAFLVRKKS